MFALDWFEEGPEQLVLPPLNAAIRHAELAIDAVGMHLDRSRRDYQFARISLLVNSFICV